MTLEEHAKHIRQLEFQLEKADYGMGMPRDYERVRELKNALIEAHAAARAAYAVTLRVAS